MEQPVRVAIAESHPVVTEGVASCGSRGSDLIRL